MAASLSLLLGRPLVIASWITRIKGKDHSRVTPGRHLHTHIHRRKPVTNSFATGQCFSLALPISVTTLCWRWCIRNPVRYAAEALNRGLWALRAPIAGSEPQSFRE